MTERDSRTRAAAVWIVLIVALLVAVYALDRATGPFPDLTVLYLVPVVIATYRFGVKYGIASGLGALAGQIAAHPALHRPVVIADALTHFAVFAFTALAVDRLVTQLAEIRSVNARRALELEVATRLQQELLASEVEDERFDLAHVMRFARQLGGDYYQVARTEAGVFVCIADISGKGVSAALFTALLRERLTAAIEETADPAGVVRLVNRGIFQVLPTEMFVTMFCALLTDADLSFVNAGHEPPMLRNARTGDVRMLLSEGGLPLGVVSEVTPKTTTVAFEPGDTLVCYTDGVTDGPAFRGDVSALVGIVRDHGGLAAPDLARYIAEAAFASEAEPLADDDATVLVLTRREVPAKLRKSESRVEA